MIPDAPYDDIKYHFFVGLGDKNAAFRDDKKAFRAKVQLERTVLLLL